MPRTWKCFMILMKVRKRKDLKTRYNVSTPIRVGR
jgi:hypothetical protein